MSKQQETEKRRKEYRQEIGGQFGRKCKRQICHAGRMPDLAIDHYQVVSKIVSADVAEMNDETLGRIVATIPEVWGRRTVLFLRLECALEKPTASVVGPSLLVTLAKIAIFGAAWDYLDEMYG